MPAQGISPDEVISLSGKVVTGDSLEPVPYAHVINKDLNRGTISDRQGAFQIDIRPSDSLLFTALGFREFEYFIPDSLKKEKTIELLIRLDPKHYELSEVNISGWNFKDRFLNIRNQEAKYKIPTAEKSENLPRPTTPSIGSPITGLYNALSRKVQLEKDGLAFINKLTYFERVDSIYNTPAVKEITGMSGMELKDFIVFCNLPSTFVYKANSYELLHAIKQCFVKYSKERGR